MKYLYEKIRELTFANTDTAYSKFLTTYRDEIFNGVNKLHKNPDYYDFEWMDKVFVTEYLDKRYTVADETEKKLLDQILYTKNEEQEYGEYTHIDDNEHIFSIENQKKLNFASTSDMSMAFRYSFVATHLCKTFLSEKRRINVLDIGCSKGTFYHFWRNLYQASKKPSLNYTGVDIRKEVIDYCNKTFKANEHTSFMQLDIMKDKLPGEKYEYILLMEIIEHVPVEDGEKILQQCWNLLDEGGYLILSSPNPKKDIGQMLTNPESHIFEYSTDEMVELLTKHKYEIEDISGWFGRGRYITLGLTEDEKTLYKEVERLGPGLRMALFSFLRPDLAECYTMVCRKTSGQIQHNIKKYSKIEIKSKKKI